MTSIFDLADDAALDDYLKLLNSVTPIDAPRMRALAKAAIRYYKGDGEARRELRGMQELERRWYESLKGDEPDYSVYDDEFFAVDVWACWVVYSRKYLRMLRKIAGTFEGVRSVADLGCGCGYTAAALKELFPEAEVVGTNVEGSVQFRVAEEVGRLRGFRVVPAVLQPADFIFASEYFEHFERPMEHLVDVLIPCRPRYLAVANSFSAISLGHFYTYRDGPRSIPGPYVGREFNDALRAGGYEKVETGFWNNRPAVWRKV